MAVLVPYPLRYYIGEALAWSHRALSAESVKCGYFLWASCSEYLCGVFSYVPWLSLGWIRDIFVHLGFLLRVLLLFRHILQTVVGCCCTPVADIGVVLQAGISVREVVRRWFVVRAHRCSWSTLPFDSSWLAVVDVVASCSRRAAGEMHLSALRAR